MSDQFSRYKAAIATGKRIVWDRGDPASGFYKRDTGKAEKPIEAIAIYRDDAGKLQCIRNVFGDGSRLDAEKIEELFASCSAYPIPEDIYRSVAEDGAAWPPEYATRLSMKEAQSDIIWTPELGRQKLGMAENERAVMGGNNPPEPTPEDEPDGHKLNGEQTPDKVAFAEVSALAAEIKRWLDTLKDGKPQTKADADRLADYSTKFATLGKKADTAREAEKKPFLDGCREVDAKWKQPIGTAETGKKRCKEIAQAWRTAEDARRAEEARKANERAETEAEKAGDTKPEPIQAERVGGLGHVRTVGERETVSWFVSDHRAYVAHLIAGEGELPGELKEAAEKIARRRAEAAPGVERHVERKAA